MSTVKRGNKINETEVIQNEEIEPLLQSGSISVEPTTNRKRPRNVSTNVISVILALFTLFGHLMLSLVLPVWSSTFMQIKSDVYSGSIIDTFWELVVFFGMFILWHFVDKEMPWRSTVGFKSLLIYGMSSAFTGAFITFASLPERTPPYLQSILGSTLIPFTVLCRYIMLRKGISFRRGVCIAIAMIGLFITMEPRIWDLTGSSGTGAGTTVSGAARILWPLSFCFGFVPDAVNRVITEQELKKKNSNTMNFLFFAQLSTLISVVLIFWVNLIPGFGMASSLQSQWNQFSVGFRCAVVSWDASCHNLALKVWLMVSAKIVGYFFHFLLIKHAEGAILASLAQAMRTPLASIFWTLYHYNESGDYLYWSPYFNITTCFLIGGLIIVVPAILMYNYFSNEEMSREKLRDQMLEVPGPQFLGSVNS